MLRCISVLGCLAFAASAAAQEPAKVILFLKSPYYADVDQSVSRSTAEKNIESSWCRPGANLAAFPWTETLASVGRGNTPVPLIQAIVSDPGDKCQYFVVYTSIYAVSPGLGKKLAGWQPTLSQPSDDKATAAIANPPALAVAPPPAPVIQSEEQDLREAGPPPLPRPKPQPAAVKRIAKPKAPVLGARAAVPPSSR